MIRILRSKVADPFFNLAAEEWLFRTAPAASQTLFLWRNAPTVVIGRNQNPWAECRVQEMEERGVALVRRQSGGGAVYQDAGNTNYTFVSAPLAAYSPAANTAVVCDALAAGFGLAAAPQGRNDIAIGGAKVSGAAFRQTDGRAFHHGTLLRDVDLGALGHLLTPSKAKMASKGVKSVRKRVTNMAPLVAGGMGHGALCEALEAAFLRRHAGAGVAVEHVDDMPAMLAREPVLREYYDKIRDWDWRFGQTPAFSHTLATRFDWGEVTLHVDSRDGVVTGVKVFSDSLVPELAERLEAALHGRAYDPAGVAQAVGAARAGSESAELGGQLADVGLWMEGAM